MSHRLFATISLLLLFQAAAVAQKPVVTTTATLTHATVYYGQGAQLEHTAKANLATGPQEVVINQIALSPDANTFQVACPENVTLLSYRFAQFTEEPKPIADALLTKMQDSIKSLEKQLLLLNNNVAIQTEVLAKTGKLIEVGNSPEKPITAAELLKLIEYYAQKIQTIQTSLFGLRQTKTLLQDSLSAIDTRRQQRLSSLTPPEQKTIGQLILQVVAQSGGPASFGLSYYTASAGWLPTYDLRAKSIDNSLKLVYKAAVHQATGLDWKQASLSLSTGNPSQGSTAPVLNPWFLNLYVPQLAKSTSSNLQEVVVIGYGSARNTDEITEDNEGNYRQKRDQTGSVSTITQSSMVQAYTSIEQSQLNINYDIDLLYDIPSDNQSVAVTIKDEAVPATYQHFATPKLDRDAFLIAQISNGQSLNLLPGDAGIIMDNIYLGKTFIDPNTTADTLQISLGRDKRIAITRTPVKEFTKTKNRGDNIIEEKTFEIALKNNKTKAIDLVLTDQYPISQIKEVEINLLDDGKAQTNPETGLLTWKIKLQPGESKKVRFAYSIKYPRGRTLRNN